jgi:hypothetical protein
MAIINVIHTRTTSLHQEPNTGDLCGRIGCNAPANAVATVHEYVALLTGGKNSAPRYALSLCDACLCSQCQAPFHVRRTDLRAVSKR